MKKLLNVLYVMTDNSYISKQGETVCVHVGGEEKVRVPAHTIESIVCFGNTTVSTPLLSFCGEKGIGLAFFSDYGKFYGRLEGPVRGNVLLRRAQYKAAEKDDVQFNMVKWFIAAKIANCRNILMRAAREGISEEASKVLTRAAGELSNIASQMGSKDCVDELRGLEGIAASKYFSVFDNMIRVNKDEFFFHSRSKRPPLDNMNCILSFLYALLVHDIRSALEGVGLDPASGFLHTLRPGRPSLALDIMEEFRAPLCDRLALALVNLRQLSERDFEKSVTGVILTDTAKRVILTAWQKRKKEEIKHTYLNEKVQIGLLPHIQALLLARYLRGDIDAYPPFYWK
ncbi:MAG TPA: type I-C CRISPR-associated endonuclease Cas1c [Bacillota bacterium]|jgi:CRISPR-associated protein Cas1|nr:type I-C CRISPR-associated endonuclease Cas1c [Bacillota bacterium]HQA66132.1 type I-C CRISPR-associated endonuclease Cas1c [Bacillota bacterium]HQO42960.1 type I-C CRISPR-associated endonuclease Cas1c [Bacillota bacterium]HQQ43612.1 type I-C CRISPR-associated endonuclease Cas1c [Bacillota bacterium]